MSNQKLYITFSIFATVIFLGVIFLSKFAFFGWNDGTIAEHEKIIESKLGDKFNFQYVTKDFPDISTAVTVLYDSGEEIMYFVIDGEFYESELVTIVDSQEVRCYEAYEALLYRVGNGSFKGVVINRIDKLEPDEYPLFISVAKILTAGNEWKWINACGSFLLRAGDSEMRKTLEQYALGQFTQEEIELNKNSEFTKEEMQTFALQLLEKY